MGADTGQTSPENIITPNSQHAHTGIELFPCSLVMTMYMLGTLLNIIYSLTMDKYDVMFTLQLLHHLKYFLYYRSAQRLTSFRRIHYVVVTGNGFS